MGEIMAGLLRLSFFRDPPFAGGSVDLNDAEVRASAEMQIDCFSVAAGNNGFQFHRAAPFQDALEIALDSTAKICLLQPEAHFLSSVVSSGEGVWDISWAAIFSARRV